MLKKVVFLGMGGTIAGLSTLPGEHVAYVAGQVPIAHMLDGVPGLSAALAGQTPVCEQVAQLDSKDMDVGHWVALAQRLNHYLEQPDVSSVIVTHGTDTLEETAYFLSCVLAGDLLIRKPVVLTCAMRPASADFADGPGNLLDAALVAVAPGCRGLLLVCAGTIHCAAKVQKVHPYRLNAFDSGESGPLGFVEAGQLRWLNDWERVSSPGVLKVDQLENVVWPRVEVVFSYAGVDGALLRCLIQEADGLSQRLRGLVVVAPGNGSIHKALEPILMQAQAQGIRVVRVSRCAHGQVVGGSAGMVPSAPLPAAKARIALMLEILHADLAGSSCLAAQ
jgi:L-asparaginase